MGGALECVAPRDSESDSFYLGEDISLQVTVQFTRSKGRYWYELATYLDPRNMREVRSRRHR
jgi:hypothetical protein